MELNKPLNEFISRETFNLPIVRSFVNQHIEKNPELFKSCNYNEVLFIKRLIHPELDFILENISLPEGYFNGREYVLDSGVSTVMASKFISKDFLHIENEDFLSLSNSRIRFFDPLNILNQYFYSKEIKDHINRELFNIFIKTGKSIPRI